MNGNSNYICQKWTIFACCSLMIIGCVVITFMSEKIAYNYHQIQTVERVTNFI
jgi:hypothetical protein